MGCLTVNFSDNVIGSRCTSNYIVDSGGVESIAIICFEARGREGFGSQEADFLTGGEKKLDRCIVKVVFQSGQENLDKNGNTCFVIGTKNCFSSAEKGIAVIPVNFNANTR
jgi:hypothetical protein